MSDYPNCGKCGKQMTPENSTAAPEYFLCDDCAIAVGLMPRRPVHTNMKISKSQRCDDGLADKARLDWLETQATQLPEMMGAPRTLHCSVMVAGAKTVREAIDACMSAND